MDAPTVVPARGIEGSPGKSHHSLARASGPESGALTRGHTQKGYRSTGIIPPRPATAPIDTDERQTVFASTGQDVIKRSRGVASTDEYLGKNEDFKLTENRNCQDHKCQQRNVRKSAPSWRSGVKKLRNVPFARRSEPNRPRMQRAKTPTLLG